VSLVETIVFAAVIAGVILLMVLAARHAGRLDRALTLHLQARGFEPLETAPDLDALRLERPLAFRGRFADGVVGVLSVGRCAGHFYVCATFRAHRSLGDEWLARFKGRSRAERRRDEDILVYWQCTDTRTNVDDILAELESELLDAIR
jgi:hypothetical protein